VSGKPVWVHAGIQPGSWQTWSSPLWPSCWPGQAGPLPGPSLMATASVRKL